jgi:hypothetical protein
MKSIYVNWLLSVVLLLTFVAGSCSSPVSDVDHTQSSEVAYNSTDLQPTLVPTFVPTVSLIEPVTEEVDDEPSLTPVGSTDTVSTPVITVIATPTPVGNPTQASSQVDMTDPKQIKESIIKDPKLCDTASGLVAQVCMDWMVDMIKANPDLCNTATGLMSYMCQSELPKGGAEGSNDLHNPCTSLTGGDKEKCEESFKSNPYSKPPPDPNNTGKADPNARLATDEIDYSNVYVQSYDPDNLPKVAKANFTELDKFSRMSKIRSGVGHDFSYNTPEYDPTRLNCKSMKHYLIPAGVPLENAAYATAPHTFQWLSIKFFAPVDGRIVGVYSSENEYGTENNFSIASTEYPGYFFMFFHLALNPELNEGSLVQAGQQIATLGSEEAWGEIAVSAKLGPGEHRLLSFLEVATDEVWQEYKNRGVSATSDVIVTKEQRDANPMACDDSEAGWFIGTTKSGTLDMQFTKWVFESTDNWFFFD